MPTKIAPICRGATLLLAFATACSSDSTGPTPERRTSSVSAELATRIGAGGAEGMVDIVTMHSPGLPPLVQVLGGSSSSRRKLSALNADLARGHPALGTRERRSLPQLSTGAAEHGWRPSFDLDAGDVLFIAAPRLPPNPATPVSFTHALGCPRTDGGPWVPLAGIQIGEFEVLATPGTGGHLVLHDIMSKPTGTWSLRSSITDANGEFETEYRAEEAAGDEQFSYLATAPQGAPCSSNTIVGYTATRVTGLTPYPAGLGGVQLGGASFSSDHTSIWYVAQSALTALAATGSAYQQDTRGQDFITLTAASLEFGGLEDIRADWKSPHISHRTGHEVDLIGKLDKQQVPDLKALRRIRDIGNGNGFRCFVENTYKSGKALPREQWHVHCSDG